MAETETVMPGRPPGLPTTLPVSLRRQMMIGWTLRFSNLGVLVGLIVLFSAAQLAS